MATGGPLDDLIAHLSRLPGIGERTATRLAFYLLRASPAFRQGFSRSVEKLSEIHLCSECATVTDTDPCSICRSSVRHTGLLCVVEKPSDIYAIERMNQYNGRYHVLHGLLSPMEGIAPQDLRLEQLFMRIQTNPPSELILAMSPTVEGDATSSYILRHLQQAKLLESTLVTRLASGLAVGTDLEFADQISLGKAFEARMRLR